MEIYINIQFSLRFLKFCFVFRIHLRTGKEGLMLKPYKEFTEFHSQTQNNWKNGNSFKKRLQSEITEKLAEYVFKIFKSSHSILAMYALFFQCIVGDSRETIIMLVLSKNYFCLMLICTLLFSGPRVILLPWAQSWQLLLLA